MYVDVFAPSSVPTKICLCYMGKYERVSAGTVSMICIPFIPPSASYTVTQPIIVVAFCALKFINTIYSRFHYKTSVSTESLVGEGLERFTAVGKMTLGKCECSPLDLY